MAVSSWFFDRTSAIKVLLQAGAKIEAKDKVSRSTYLEV